MSNKNKEMLKVFWGVMHNNEKYIQLIIPNCYVKDVYNIDYDLLYKKGYHNIIFDIDNTILPVNDIYKGNVGKVPDHIKTTSKDYKYPHNYKGSYVKQQYLPDELIGKHYYIPKESSKYEIALKQVYDKIEKK